MDAETLSKAQFLVYDAMEAWGSPEAADKVREALQVDPENPDALGMMGSLSDNVEETKSFLQRSLASAQGRLGPNFEKKLKGIFWLELDTRPYMRALAAMAHFESQFGDRKAAIAIYERMLRLNPNDNQGVRYEFLGLLLAERKLVKARKLLEAYPDEGSAWFMWGRVLYYFTMKDHAKATQLLKKARRANRYVEHYLTGEYAFPEGLPDMFQYGSQEEAILAVADLGEAWSRRKYALLWLHAQLSGDTAMIRYVGRMIDGR